MRVKHFAKVVADSLQGRAGRSGFGEFGQPIRDNASNEARSVGQVARQLFRIFRRRRIGESERRQGRDKPGGIAASNQTLRARVRRFWFERGLGNDFNRVYRLVAPEHAKARKIRDRPNRQRLETLELLLVVRIAIARRIARFGGRLELDKGARRLTSALEGDVRPTNASVANSGTTTSSFDEISGSSDSSRRWNSGANACSRLLGPARRCSRMRRAYSMIASVDIAPR
jgi:hypothetical protein